jgi:TRAP-type C4-dicarboxylate transport system substrate-binding protein
MGHEGDFNTFGESGVLQTPILTLLLSLAAGIPMTVAASAQEMTFRFTHVFPGTHMQWTEAGGYFAKLVEESSDGKIKIEPYHSGQLGKESVTLIGSGLADAGVIAPSYEAAKLPLTSVAELPGMSTTSCEGTARMWNLVKEGGAIDEAELKPLGLHALFVNVLPPYKLATNRKRVSSLAEASGLKIRANGAAMDKAARALNAVPVMVPVTEFYDSLSRGTVDGGFWSMGSTKAVGLDSVIHYMVEGAQIGTAVTIDVINERVWEGLDESTKKLMTDAALKTQKHFCTFTDEQEKRVVAELVAAGSLELVPLSDEEKARWRDTLAAVADAWAGKMDSTGRPGTQILEAYRAAPANF